MAPAQPPAEAARGVAYPFYLRARQLMATLGMSDTELRRRSGVTVNTLKNLAVITRRPQARVVNAVADAVGMDRVEAHRLAGLIPAEMPDNDINVRDAIERSAEFSEAQRRALLQLVDIFTEANTNSHTES